MLEFLGDVTAVVVGIYIYYKIKDWIAFRRYR